MIFGGEGALRPKIVVDRVFVYWEFKIMNGSWVENKDAKTWPVLV